MVPGSIRGQSVYLVLVTWLSLKVYHIMLLDIKIETVVLWSKFIRWFWRDPWTNRYEKQILDLVSEAFIETINVTFFFKYTYVCRHSSILNW